MEGCAGEANPGIRKPIPAAPDSPVTFRGAAANIVYIDWDDGLAVVARLDRRGPSRAYREGAGRNPGPEPDRERGASLIGPIPAEYATRSRVR